MLHELEHKCSGVASLLKKTLNVLRLEKWLHDEPMSMERAPGICLQAAETETCVAKSSALTLNIAAKMWPSSAVSLNGALGSMSHPKNTWENACVVEGGQNIYHMNAVAPL